MSTCKDCIHEKVCDNLIAHGLPWEDGKYPAEKCCDHFKPTADVVEVVRCKDCKHHPDNGGECDRSITHTSRDYVCEVNTYRYIGLDYCSYGERREG